MTNVQADQPAPLRSTRLQALQSQVSGGNLDALDVFWNELIDRGTPLVERVDEDHSLITFIWGGDESTSSVLVAGGLSGTEFAPLKLLGSTDIWYRSYLAQNDLRTTYELLSDPPLVPSTLDWRAERRMLADHRGWRTDPHNPRVFSLGDPMPPTSIIELPDAPSQEWLVEREGSPRGNVAVHQLRDDSTTRTATVYTPFGFDRAHSPYPLVVVFDGWAYLRMKLTTTLDNLIAHSRIPPLVCVMIDQTDRSSELTCNEAFTDFVAQELASSWIPSRFNTTTDPRRIAVAGSSYGGLAAAYAALRHPSVFGNVLSQSGSFWWGPGATLPADLSDSSIQWDWLTRQFEQRPTSPTRFYLEVGQLEVGVRPGIDPDQVVANGDMRDVLRTRGYEVKHVEFNGGHEHFCWQGSVADGLSYLLG